MVWQGKSQKISRAMADGGAPEIWRSSTTPQRNISQILSNQMTVTTEHRVREELQKYLNIRLLVAKSSGVGFYLVWTLMPFSKWRICGMHVSWVRLIYWIDQKAIESISVISVHWFIEGALNESFGQPFFGANIKKFWNKRGCLSAWSLFLIFLLVQQLKKTTSVSDSLSLILHLTKTQQKACVNVLHLTQNSIKKQLVWTYST